eukprot:COSAG01_NODE_16430_length_1237_cov_0.764499_2_plen_175_part_00
MKHIRVDLRATERFIVCLEILRESAAATDLRSLARQHGLERAGELVHEPWKASQLPLRTHKIAYPDQASRRGTNTQNTATKEKLGSVICVCRPTLRSSNRSIRTTVALLPVLACLEQPRLVLELRTAGVKHARGVDTPQPHRPTLAAVSPQVVRQRNPSLSGRRLRDPATQRTA